MRIGIRFLFPRRLRKKNVFAINDDVAQSFQLRQLLDPRRQGRRKAGLALRGCRDPF